MIYFLRDLLDIYNFYFEYIRADSPILPQKLTQNIRNDLFCVDIKSTIFIALGLSAKMDPADEIFV